MPNVSTLTNISFPVGPDLSGMLVRLLTFPFLRGVGSVDGLACRRRVERARVLACHSRAFDTRSGHKKARRARTLRAKEKGPEGPLG